MSRFVCQCGHPGLGCICPRRSTPTPTHVARNYTTDHLGVTRFVDRYDITAEMELSSNAEIRIRLHDNDNGIEVEWFPNRYDLLEVVKKLCHDADEFGL